MAIARRKAKKKVTKRLAVRKVAKKAARRTTSKKRAPRRAAGKKRIKVEVEQYASGYGSITITPVSSSVCGKYMRHMKEVCGRCYGAAYSPVCSAHIDDGPEAKRFLDQNPDIASRLEWDSRVVVMMDPYKFGMLLGYDAEHVEV